MNVRNSAISQINKSPGFPIFVMEPLKFQCSSLPTQCRKSKPDNVSGKKKSRVPRLWSKGNVKTPYPGSKYNVRIRSLKTCLAHALITCGGLKRTLSTVAYISVLFYSNVNNLNCIAIADMVKFTGMEHRKRAHPFKSRYNH